MSAKYVVLLRVAQENLAALLAQPGAELIKLDKETPDPVVKHTRQNRFVNGRRDKGISGRSLLLQIMSDGKVHTTQEIVDAFSERGFAANSASPVLTHLLKENKIKKLSQGRFISGNVTAMKL